MRECVKPKIYERMCIEEGKKSFYERMCTVENVFLGKGEGRQYFNHVSCLKKNKNFFTRNRIKARFSTLILTSRGKRGKHKKRLVSNCTYCNTYCTYLPEFVSNCTYCKTYSTYLPILYIL
jgi:hypothetical protein